MEWRRSKKAMGTDIEISVITDDPNIERRINTIFDMFLSFEAEFSRFLPLSSLSILNREKKHIVSNRFIELLRHCQGAYEKTNGFFNPLVDVSALGYSHSFEQKNFTITARASNLHFEKIQIDGNTITLQEHQNLDFGGICKGYAVQVASSVLRNFGYDNFFINAGGDIYASGKNNDGDKWVIGIENPFDGNLIASVSITDKAITTSGNYKRKWKVGGEEHHHILDPMTGKNKFDTASVTLVSENCTEADAYTKAAYNMEASEALVFIEKNNLSGILVMSNGKILYSNDFIKKYEVNFC